MAVERDGTSVALADIRAERARQIHDEKWSAAHDDEHRSGEMARAAACYAMQSTLGGPDRVFEVDVSGGTRMFKRKFFSVGTIDILHLLWPWEGKWWKPKDRRSDLVRAGALIVAEIERLDRSARKAA